MLDWVSSEVISFAVFTLLVLGAAAFGGQWGARPWYDVLSKPAWTPPDWLFPVAWSLIYLMIAVAGWLVWENGGAQRSLLVTVWAVQLLLNGVWSYIFFARKAIAVAFFDILALWLSIAVFIGLAWGVSQLAALLFVPYLAWVTYAGALNGAIWRRNPVHTRHGTAG
jgi:benzodiazapine receptor